MRLYHGDCLSELAKVEDHSIDLILCDLPYGTTECRWDSVIPFAPLWEHYRRVIKKDRAIVLFSVQPFTSALVMSNPNWFRYQWVWQKTRPSGFIHCNDAPLKEHEDICVFGASVGVYNPQMEDAPLRKEGKRKVKAHAAVCNAPREREFNNGGKAYPRSILFFPNPNHNNIHPTQKPVDLCEYLIKTYSNPNDVVLDNCMGSGSTGVAALQTGRDFIGIERDEEYFRLASARIDEVKCRMDSYIL